MNRLERRLALWDKAKKYHNLTLNAERRLSNFPLWKRIFLFWHFKKFRDKIKSYQELRFVYSMTALAMKKGR